MERRRVLWLCSLGGGLALGIGIALWALCSPASVGCTTNIVVLTGGRITSKGCAAYSVAAHVGAGLVVLGSVLLVGRFVLGRVQRPAATASDVRHEASPVSGELPGRQVETPPAAPSAATAGGTAEAPAPAPVERTVEPPVEAPAPAPAAVGAANGSGNGNGHRPRLEAVGAAPSGDAPVELDAARARARSRELPLVDLPPGWYGNPNNPGGSVQWWDGTRLLDERPGA